MSGVSLGGLRTSAGNSGIKRFYQGAEPVAASGGYLIMLDGRPVITPLRNSLLLPGPALAEAVAAEWNAQQDKVDLAGMVITRLSATAIDRVAGRESDIVDEILAYAETDLLCYRAERPESLVQRQMRSWQPVLDWLAHTHDARLIARTGVSFIEQPAAALAGLRAAVERDGGAFALAGLYNLVHGLGSLALGLAVRDRHLTAEEAYDAAMVDELYQAELWGEDAEAARRRAEIKADVIAAARFLALLEA